MIEKDKLRKADVYSGAVIFLFGLWIVLQALKMPMKDSWGGVQNVWYVSPALFPLFVGSMIMLLGALLTRTALKRIGFKEFKNTVRWLLSKALFQFLNTLTNLRFYTIARKKQVGLEAWRQRSSRLEAESSKQGKVGCREAQGSKLSVQG